MNANELPDNVYKIVNREVYDSNIMLILRAMKISRQ